MPFLLHIFLFAVFICRVCFSCLSLSLSCLQICNEKWTHSSIWWWWFCAPLNRQFSVTFVSTKYHIKFDHRSIVFPKYIMLFSPFTTHFANFIIKVFRSILFAIHIFYYIIILLLALTSFHSAFGSATLRFTYILSTSSWAVVVVDLFKFIFMRLPSSLHCTLMASLYMVELSPNSCDVISSFDFVALYSRIDLYSRYIVEYFSFLLLALYLFFLSLTCFPFLQL